MAKRFIFVLLTGFFSAVFFCGLLMAKEDTAQITLKKTATSKQKLYTYTVKKGDMISSIVRQIPNISEQDMGDNYKIIKDLNPDITDINKLSSGQLLVLPGKPRSDSSQDNMESKNEEDADSSATSSAKNAGQNTYSVRKGDTLIKIIYRELKVKTNTRQMLKLIKSINPRIVNVNRIYAGQTIKLPGKKVFVNALNKETAEMAGQADIAAELEEIIELTEKIIMPPEARLSLIKHVVTQMNGSMMTTGNYYLPIPETGQIIIDCTKIPVIEFEDQSVMFLDLDNRAEDNLKKIINDNWANFSLIKVDKKDDVIAVIKKIFNTAKDYSMTKRETPLTIGTLPPVDLLVDWIITKTNSEEPKPPMQGLRIVYGNNPLLPKSIKNYAQKNGLIITEFSEETGIAESPEEIYSMPPMTIFPTTSVKDFSYSLISYLGFKADKDAEIKVFDIVKDGFNLSIEADVLVQYAGKQYIIYSRILPAQFTSALKKAGYEIIFLNEDDKPKIIMEKVLTGLNSTFAHGFFTFSGVDKNQAPYTLSFHGTKIKTDNNLYIVDFEIDQGLSSLLRESWEATVARY